MSLPLEFWIILWKVVLIGGVVLFGGMAVWVSIGGLFDIKRLFQRIREKHLQEQEAESAAAESPPGSQ